MCVSEWNEGGNNDRGNKTGNKRGIDAVKKYTFEKWSELGACGKCGKVEQQWLDTYENACEEVKRGESFAVKWRKNNER